MCNGNQRGQIEVCEELNDKEFDKNLHQYNIIRAVSMRKLSENTLLARKKSLTVP